MKRIGIISICLALLLLAGSIVYIRVSAQAKKKTNTTVGTGAGVHSTDPVEPLVTIVPEPANPQQPVAEPVQVLPPIAEAKRTFTDSFSTSKVLEESGQNKILDPDWWLNSGAYFYSGNGVGSTVAGELAIGSKWQKSYAQSNPSETDGGVHPQNIFRLVTRTKWKVFTQQVYFEIARYIPSTNLNRKESNGVFLFNRYLDGDNVYYAGIRVDGTVSLKKKIHGVYYDMAHAQIVKDTKYNRETNPNLLPEKTWIGFQTRVWDNADKSVGIAIYLDLQNNGTWTKVLETKDNGRSYGGPVFTEPGYAGIRTDFMDANFKAYSIVEEG